MLRLWGTRRSRASRAIWLAEEAGIDLPLRVVWQAYRLDDPTAAGAPLNTRSPDFLRLNPMGSIPALEDGGLLLTESMAIALHLARTRGGALGPRDEGENGRMMQWALFAASSVEEPALAILTAQERGQGGAEALERGAAALMRPLGAAEAHLEGREWLLDRFTVADVLLAECVRYAQGHRPLMDAHPGVAAWLARAQARPGFQRMWAARDQEPVRP